MLSATSKKHVLSSYCLGSRGYCLTAVCYCLTIWYCGVWHEDKTPRGRENVLSIATVLGSIWYCLTAVRYCLIVWYCGVWHEDNTPRGKVVTHANANARRRSVCSVFGYAFEV